MDLPDSERERDPRNALDEFWSMAHKKYGSAIRFGLSDEDQAKLLQIETLLDLTQKAQAQTTAD